MHIACSAVAHAHAEKTPVRVHYINANANANAKIQLNKQLPSRFIGSRPPRGSEVEGYMASSISYEIVADSGSKYPLLYGKSSVEFKNKLKKPLLGGKMWQKMRYFWLRLLRPLSTLYTNTTKASLSSAFLEKHFDCAWLRLRILPSLHARSTLNVVCVCNCVCICVARVSQACDTPTRYFRG